MSLQEKRVCNRCGKEFDIFDLQQDFTIHKQVQYGSVYDGCYVDYHLCCDCFDRAVQECKVSPIRWSQYIKFKY